jgi:uracil-DNA glycosylase
VTASEASRAPRSRRAARPPAPSSLDALLAGVRACRACAEHLPLGPRPILRADMRARILVVGQAPGARVHRTGVPWDDASGERLRAWMGIDRATFDDGSAIAIVPIGFCYPGRAASGDRPPRPECARLWHAPLLAAMPHVALTLVIGAHAQRHYLGARRKDSLRETVRAWRDYAPRYLPLPHPSPRNNPWLARNPWFEGELLPELRRRVRLLLR